VPVRVSARWRVVLPLFLFTHRERERERERVCACFGGGEPSGMMIMIISMIMNREIWGGESAS